MRRAGAIGWVVREDDVPWTIVAALYLRDALGLDFDRVLAAPPLSPTVPRITGPGAVGVITSPILLEPATTAAWNSWFARILWADLNENGESRDPQRFEPAGTPLAALDPAILKAAASWVTTQRVARQQALRKRPHPDALLVTRLVEQIEGERGGPVPPFALQLNAIPVTGPWVNFVGSDSALLSYQSRDDGSLLKPILEEAITRWR